MSTRRLTTEKFIEKARKVHGDRYGYECFIKIKEITNKIEKEYESKN